MKKSSSISRIAIFFAVMITIHFVTSLVLQFVPSGIQPTLVHIPVVIASIIYGPRTGAILGLLMGLFSVTMNTVVLTPASYLFSPFVPHGNLYSCYCSHSADPDRCDTLLCLQILTQSRRTCHSCRRWLHDQYRLCLKRHLLLLRS